jgi:hypothetical protein
LVALVGKPSPPRYVVGGNSFTLRWNTCYDDEAQERSGGLVQSMSAVEAFVRAGLVVRVCLITLIFAM